MSESPYLIKAEESGLPNFPGGRVIGQAFKTGLGNLHRMLTPEGFVILELDEIYDQELGVAPDIPGGELINNPLDIEGNRNIGALQPGDFFFWREKLVARKNLNIHSPTASHIQRNAPPTCPKTPEQEPPNDNDNQLAFGDSPFDTPSPPHVPSAKGSPLQSQDRVPVDSTRALFYDHEEPPNYDMAPPLPDNFASWKDAEKYAQLHGKDHGYCVTISKSWKTRQGRYKAWLSCKKAGAIRVIDECRKRKRTSHKMETPCPFSMNITERTDGRFYLTYRENPEFMVHNHEPFDDPSAFPELRELTDLDKELIHNNSITGVPTHATTAQFRTLFPSKKVLPRDIYNHVAKAKRELRKGMPPPKAFIEQLKREQAAGLIYFHHELDSNGHISRLFVADRRSIKYFNINPDVLLMDCTYKASLTAPEPLEEAHANLPTFEVTDQPVWYAPSRHCWSRWNG